MWWFGRKARVRWFAVGKDRGRTEIGARKLLVVLTGVPVFEIEPSRRRARALEVCSPVQADGCGGFCLGRFTVDMGCSNTFCLRVRSTDVRPSEDKVCTRGAGRPELPGWYGVSDSGEVTRLEEGCVEAELGGDLRVEMWLMASPEPGVYFHAPVVHKGEKNRLIPGFTIPLGCSNAFSVLVAGEWRRAPKKACAAPAGAKTGE